MGLNLYTGSNGVGFTREQAGSDSQYVSTIGNDQGAANLAATIATNQANLALAKQQNDWNVEQWNNENAYNTPSAQVQRYMEAGINPLSIDGLTNGNSSSLTSSNLANQVAPQIEPNNNTQNLLQGLQTLLGAAQGVVNAKKLGLESQQLDIQRNIADAQIRGFNASTASQEFKNSKQEETYFNEQELIKANTANIKSSTALQDQEKATVTENLYWLQKMKPYELNNLIQTGKNLAQECQNLKADERYKLLQSAEESFRVGSWSKGINPDSKGLERVLDLFINNPDGAADVIGNIISKGSQGFKNSDTFGPLIQKLDNFLDRVSSFLPGSNSHYNPQLERVIPDNSSGGRW